MKNFLGRGMGEAAGIFADRIQVAPADRVLEDGTRLVLINWGDAGWFGAAYCVSVQPVRGLGFTTPELRWSKRKALADGERLWLETRAAA